MKKIVCIPLLLPLFFQLSVQASNNLEYDYVTGWTKDGTWNVYTGSAFGPDGRDYDGEKFETDTDDKKTQVGNPREGILNLKGVANEYKDSIYKDVDDIQYKHIALYYWMKKCKKSLSGEILMLIAMYLM